jgi:hypothetical protein
MTQELKTHPGFHPEYHFPPGTTVNFADRIVIGSCYSFEAGGELRCLRRGDHQVPGLRVGVYLAHLHGLTAPPSAGVQSGR